MTYHYWNYPPKADPIQYEFTAFGLDDLQDAGLTGQVSRGDTFTMPGSASLTFNVTDNDSSLSGDRFFYRNDNAIDRSFQTSSIIEDEAEVGNGGQIYAEKFFFVRDENGNRYIMVEIEQEGSGENYYTFLSRSGPPPAGAVLTVGGSCNVFGSWVRYDKLGAGEVVVPGELIVGTSGDDTLTGFSGDDTIVGGGGRDFLDGAGGNDLIQGQGSADTLIGGAGEDVLEAGRGASDLLTGGADADTFRFEDSFGTDTITDFERGVDVVDLGALSLIGGFSALTITDGASGAVVDTTQGLIVLEGVAAADLSDADFIFPDNIVGTAGDDLLSGTPGDDVFVALGGNDTLIGGGGRDLMDGGEGNDLIQGQGSADTLIGGAGEDVLEAGRGASDLLTGGADADTFRFEDSFGTDTITDFERGVDVVDLGALSLIGGFSALTITDGASGAVVDTTQGLIVLEGVAAADLSDADFIFPDNIVGTAGDDLLSGTPGDDVFVALGGNDTLIGGGGRDLMDGGEGNDLIQGQGSADTLIGGAGEDVLEAGRGASDLLTGGADADTFRFEESFGTDTITDFETGLDVIDLVALSLAGGFSALTITDGASGAVVDTTQGVIILEGVALADVTDTLFLF
ncbi:calcium-binding protein (plasmid) [Leisingera sp. NJS201]|uniref:calcium-binding protein n=1 Tax=Leisingera sp. NJS201 TaxID=2508306 RepID=UPI0010713948|nr:calcium-binding protein [Leisingera sp. NJS201]QBR38577.1 calcium-binding protein [Leisingera sp. NJS201]